MIAHFKRPDVVFYKFIIQVSIGSFGRLVKFECYVNLVHLPFKVSRLDATIGIEKPISHGIKRHGAIHGTGIYIDIS